MAEIPFPILTVKGPPFERGYQHGSQARDRILVGIETHRRSIKFFTGVDWADAVALAEAYLPHLVGHAPAMLEELRGIAQGSGIPLADILTLNLRAELTFTPKMAETRQSQGCTTFAVLPEASADGHTYLGQTWDSLAGLVDVCIVLRSEGPGQPRYLSVGEAGVPAMIGLNEFGIGVVRNALVAECAGSGPGVPMNAAHYRMLTSQILGDALAGVTASRLATPWCYVVGAPGDAIALEVAPPEFDYVHDSAGIITHANHYVSARLHVRDLNKAAAPHSLLRERRMRRYLGARRGAIDAATLREGVKDHFNYPDSICRHGDERDPADGRMATVFAVVMDLDERVVYYSEGQPCENPYRVLSL